MSDDEYGLDLGSLQSSITEAWELYSDGTDGVPCVDWSEIMGATVEELVERLRGYAPCREVLDSFRLAQRETDVIPMSFDVRRAACARRRAGRSAAAIDAPRCISHPTAPPSFPCRRMSARFVCRQ